ncbi:MAG: hypothetical protein ABW196_02855 [Solirubrobacterales bacterium]
MSDERGYTLIELLVGTMVAMVVFGAILTVIQVSVRVQADNAQRVAINQRGRPAMTRIIERLHASCMAPGLAPVQVGSGDSTMVLLSKPGSDVAPMPDRYLIGLSGDTLIEEDFPAIGGEAPEWTFATKPDSYFEIVDGVEQARLGKPAAPTPLFRYYAYEDANDDGKVETVLLDTPLDEEAAARAVQVNIAFKVTARSGSEDDADGSITLTDSATLRIEPASEDSAQVNLPCV